MAVQELDDWADKLKQTYPLFTLKDAVVGIDASYYLDLRLNKSIEEQLKLALGGLPFCLKRTLENDIAAFHEAGVTLVFVFNGLDFVNKNPSSARSFDSMKAQEDGWSHYHGGDANLPPKDFGRAKFPIEVLYRYLRKLLVDNDVPYQVAPYSAVAQLSYLYHLSDQYVNAIMGSTEAFLFDVDKIITNIDNKKPSFDWVSKSVCEDRLGKVTGTVFRDAQLMLGTSFLPTFPLLDRPAPNAKSSIADALNLLNSAGRSVTQLCNQYREDPLIQSSQYADRYKKAIMTIKHHVVLESDGLVAPLDFDHAPGDVHEFVGQRLPEELFFYISKGILGSRIPNWLTSGEIILSLPGGVLDFEPYRRLVIEQINPLRTQGLKILAESLNYYYQSRIVKVKTWEGRDTENLTIQLKTVPSLKAVASPWKVRQGDLPPAEDKSDGTASFLTCLQSLKDPSFAAKTITKGRVEHPALRTRSEIVSNVLWRFLQIRGYVNDKHELTTFGAMLEAALIAIEPTDNMPELAVIAVEMLRLGLLNTSSVTGVTVPPTDKAYKHKTCTSLTSKIACIGRLKHKARGYVGPLDQELLTFAEMVAAVRSSLRDLIETILTSMLLNGEVERTRDDWFELPQQLPFICDNGATLGIATKTYLDAIHETDPITDDLKNSVKNLEGKYKWFENVKGGTLTKSLESAFSLWDAVYAATQHGSKEYKDSKIFADTNEWLISRR